MKESIFNLDTRRFYFKTWQLGFEFWMINYGLRDVRVKKYFGAREGEIPSFLLLDQHKTYLEEKGYKDLYEKLDVMTDRNIVEDFLKKEYLKPTLGKEKVILQWLKETEYFISHVYPNRDALFRKGTGSKVEIIVRDGIHVSFDDPDVARAFRSQCLEKNLRCLNPDFQHYIDEKTGADLGGVFSVPESVEEFIECYKAYTNEKGEIQKFILPRGFSLTKYIIPALMSLNCEWGWPKVETISYEVEFPDLKDVPYEYQEIAFEYAKNLGHCLMRFYCSEGKTFISWLLAKKLKQRTLFLADKTDLVEQTYKDAINTFDGEIDASVWHSNADKKKMRVADITVAGIDKWIIACKKDPTIMDTFGIVIIDEAISTGLSRQRMKFIARLKSKYIFLLDAHPVRSDNMQVIQKHIQGFTVTADNPRVMPEPIVQEIESDWHELKEYQPKRDTKRSQNLYRSKHGVPEIVTSSYRNQLIVDSLINELEANSKAVILFYSDYINHLRRIAQMMRDRGYEMDYASGSKTSESCGHFNISWTPVSNKDAYRKIEEGKSRVLGASSVAKKGINVKCFNTILIGVPIGDTNKIAQILGRVQREYPGKNTIKIMSVMDRQSDFFYKREQGMLRSMKRIAHQGR